MVRYILSELNPRVHSESRLKLQIITPSKAIASYLRIPYYSLESLALNIVHRRGIRVASTWLSRRLLQNAVAEVIETKDIEGTASVFLSTIKEIFRSGVNLTQLQVSLDPRIKQLSSLAIAYKNQLRKVKSIDVAELYWQGALDISYQKAYTFYGYFAPNQDELALINAISGQNSILVLPVANLYPQNQQAINWLQSQGWQWQENREAREKEGLGQLQNCFRSSAVLPTEASLNVYPNLLEEVRGVLTQVKVLQSQGVVAQDIVLVTREEQLYGEVLIDVAREYQLPIEVSYELSLAQTRFGAWVKLLLSVIRDNFPFETTAKLLSHPLAKQMSRDKWSIARETHPQGLIAWQQLGIDLSLLDFPVNCSRRLWLERILAIFTTWEILENTKSCAREVIAYYRLQEILTELSNYPEQELNQQLLISEINEILALLTVPAQPGQGGIKLHTPTTLYGTNFPYIFVLGCAEGILPRAIADDPILDFHSRKQLAQQGLNIPTATDIATKETWDFYCLLNVPTQQVIFSYPELIDRNSIVPSPYLSTLGLKPSQRDNLPISSVEQARQLYLRQPNLLPPTKSLLINDITQALQVEARRESANPPDQYDGVVGISIDAQSRIFSASQLTQLGQCPFKWFSAQLLKLKKLPEATLDLDAAKRGNLYHRCLELSLAKINTASDLAQFNQAQLAQAFAVAEQELNLTKLPGWSNQRLEHLNLIALNLATAEFLPPEREVIARETKFMMEWHGLQVQGQVDRIDRTDAGLTVIDYKTSSVTPPGVKDETGKANLDIQLAVYQDAIARQYPQATIATAGYYSLTKKKIINRPLQDPTRLATFAQQVKTSLEQGYYPVAPDVDRQACRYCNYDLVCRQGDRLSRKNINLLSS